MLKTTKVKMGKDKERIEEEVTETEIGQHSSTITRGATGKWGFEIKAYGTNIEEVNTASNAMIANVRKTIQENISDMSRKQEKLVDLCGGGKE